VLLARHTPPIAKQPEVRLKPTFEVEVAEPTIARPESVVVPNPVDETESAVVDALLTTSRSLPVPLPHTVRPAYGDDVPTESEPAVSVPTLPVVENELVDDAIEAKKLVVVAAVPVALLKVKFCNVEEPERVRLVPERLVTVPFAAKKLVVVAEVPVALLKLKF